MTDNTSVVEGTADNETQNVEQTTEENTPETNEQPTKKKNNFDKMKDKLKSKLDEKDNQLTQKEQELEDLKKDVAVMKYGRDIVESEQVQEYMSKYPGMGYEEASRLAGVSAPTPSNAYAIPGTSKPVNEEKSTYSERQLDDIRVSDPSKYSELIGKIAKGELKLV